MVYWTGHIQFSLSDFATPKMADVCAGVKAKNTKTPVVCIPHSKDWLTDLRAEGPSIFTNELANTQAQCDAVNAAGPWGEPEMLLPGVSYSSPIFWDSHAKARKKACVLPDSWSIADFVKHRPRLNKALKQSLIDLPKGSSVLDYGCGYGRWASLIEGLGLTYLGVDTSKVTLALDPDERRTLYKFGDLLPAAKTIFIFDVLKHMRRSDLPILRDLLRASKAQVIMVEQQNGIGIEGDVREDYAGTFPGLMSCDSCQTGRISWSIYRGTVR
jgi:hypothetical protein